MYLRQQGQKTWIDTTALDQVNQSEEFATWIAEHIQLTATYGLTNKKHRILFTQLVPKLEVGTGTMSR